MKYSSQADFYDFARMLYVFEDVVKNAQPIEVHSDKYVGTKREDSNLKQMFVLLSAFEDGKFIVPVEFNIKEFSNHDKNKLYLSVTLQKIEADLMEHPPQHNVATKNSKSTSAHSIADIIKNVNPLDKYFLKYVPESLLNAEQIIAKNEAINEDQIRIGDMRYEYAVENNPSLARDMLIEKSNREGQTAKHQFILDTFGVICYDKNKRKRVAKKFSGNCNRPEIFATYRVKGEEKREIHPDLTSTTQGRRQAWKTLG